jgi:hypothetical protein
MDKDKVEVELVSRFINHRITINGVSYIVSDEWSETESSPETYVTLEETGDMADDDVAERVLTLLDEHKGG